MGKGYFLWLYLLMANTLFAQQMPFIFVPGGPANVQVIFQDHLGRLWVGGAEDVACFDGSRFYSLRDLGFPAATGTTAITEDRDGAIWIGSDLGVYRFYRGSVTKVMPGYVRALAASSGVVLVLAGPVGPDWPRGSFLFRIRWSGRVWESEKITGLSWPNWFSLDRTGALLIPYTAGWQEIRIKDIVAWHSGRPLTVAEHESRRGFGKVLRDRFGCVWNRTSPFTTYQCPGEREPTELPAFISNESSYFWEGGDGTMIFVNNGGLVMGRPESFRLTTAAHGLPSLNAAIMALDGTVWLGGTRGIYRWPQPYRLEYWTAKEGFAGYGGICRAGNKIFAGKDQEGIEVLSDDRARWVPLPKTKSLGLVYGLIDDLKGGLFAGLRFGGVAQVRMDGTIIAQAGRHQDGFIKFERTPDGQLWAVGIGVCRVKQVGSRLALEAEKLFDGKLVLDVEVQQNTGQLWVCSQDGLIRKEPDGWRSITVRDGLRTNFCRSLAVLPNGDLWMGYDTGPSFARVRLGPSGKVTVKAFGPSSEGGNDQVMFMDVDSHGWLWRGTPDGVYVADPSDAENNLWTHLDQGDGLPNSDVNKQGFYNDSDGSVWWLARDASVVHFLPPSDFVHPSFAPQVFVSSFSLNSAAAKLAGTVSTIPPGSTITAHIGSLQFDRRNALRLRYRTLPEHTTWRDSRDLDLPLGVIGWGDHSIEVQAKLGTGPWSGTAVQAFKVLRPFWATWPFLLGLGFVGTAAGCGAYRLDQRRKKIERRALPDLAALRVDALVPDAHALLETTLAGRFVPKHVLARGGFATVFDGLDKTQNRRCAIKVFHREVADQGLAQRFAQEVTALETVVHPNVVRIYGHGETPAGVPYLVMEFVEGKTLREAIPPAGLPPPEVASLLRQAGNALAAIHSHGICHRDLKPENLMIRNRELVLIDFSIAIVKSPDKTVHGLSRAAGTIQYMAPEQAVGWADASSDIYSLAKVAIEMITGKRLSELLPEASRDLPERVREFLAQLPIGLSPESINLIAGALAFDPERRPHDAVAFAERIAGDLEKEA